MKTHIAVAFDRFFLVLTFLGGFVGDGIRTLGVVTA